jgi:hypothetical protein
VRDLCSFAHCATVSAPGIQRVNVQGLWHRSYLSHSGGLRCRGDRIKLPSHLVPLPCRWIPVSGRFPHHGRPCSRTSYSHRVSASGHDLAANTMQHPRPPKEGLPQPGLPSMRGRRPFHEYSRFATQPTIWESLVVHGRTPQTWTRYVRTW